MRFPVPPDHLNLGAVSVTDAAIDLGVGKATVGDWC